MSVTLPNDVDVLIQDVYVFHPGATLPDLTADTDRPQLPVYVYVRYDNLQIPAWVVVDRDVYRTLQISGRMFKLKYHTKLRQLLSVSFDAQTYYPLLAEEPVRQSVT